MGDDKKSFLSHFLVIGAGTFLNLLIGLATTPIITRIVDPDIYGRLSIFNVYVGIVVMILCLGLDQTLVRFFYQSNELNDKKRLLKFCFLIPFICSIIFSIIIFSLSVTDIVKFEFSSTIIFVLGLNVIFSVANRISQLVLRLMYESKAYSFCNVLHKVVYVVLALIGIKIFKNHYLLILTIATSISVLIPTFYAVVYSKKFWKWKGISFPDNKVELIKYGLPLILSMGLTTLFQAIDKLFLNHYCEYSDVGIYSSAMTLINVFAIVQTTFNALWGPMQVEHYTNNQEDKSFFQRGNGLITVVMFFIGIHLMLFKDVFAVLLGEEYREAAYIMPFLIFNPIMYTISESSNCGIGFSKKSYLNIIVAAGACLTNVVGNFILVPEYGCKGAAISTGIAYIVFWFLRMVLSNKYYYVDYKVGKFFCLLLVTVIYAYFNTFFVFGLWTIIGYIVCMVIFVFLYRQNFVEGIQLLKKQLVNKSKK